MNLPIEYLNIIRSRIAILDQFAEHCQAVQGPEVPESVRKEMTLKCMDAIKVDAQNIIDNAVTIQNLISL